MDIGIANYLLSPLTEPNLAAAFEKLQTPVAAGVDEKPRAKLIAVVGTRGGVGATSVAINLAGVLAEQTHQRVALVDLDPQEGSVALALDIEPTHGLRDALEKPERIDSLFLERVMAKVGKYLSVLSAEESLVEELAVNVQAADPLLAELTAKYDYVVLDVPRHVTGFVQACLARADFTLLVTELSLLCLRDTLRMQDAMRDGWKAKPPLVIASRVGLAGKQEVPVADFEKGIGTKIFAQIGFAPDVFMAMTRDIPAIKYKAHAGVKPFYHLAATIAPDVKPAATQTKSAFSFPFFKKKGD
jgi:pilus assembly protein CpaE